MNFIILTVSDLTHSSVDPVSPKINWARIDEADNFAETVKLYRQGKYDEASFRRFRLQHGAYGTRMTSDYAMVRVPLHAFGSKIDYEFNKDINGKSRAVLSYVNSVNGGQNLVKWFGGEFICLDLNQLQRFNEKIDFYFKYFENSF